MKQISLITVNNPGVEAAEKTVGDLLKINQDFDIKIYHKNLKNPETKADYIEYCDIDEILDKVWKTSDAIIWFTATGIVVRKIAPFLKSKTIDPAVLIMNLSRTQIIPLLSGHLGGANDLAQKLTEINSALTSFITTATDSLNIFAFDNFAKKAGFEITNIEELAKISNSLINNQSVNLITYPEIFKYLKKEGIDETKIRFYHYHEFKNTIKLTGKEFGEYNDIKELREKAINYYEKNIQGKIIEHFELGKIFFTGKGIDKIRLSSAKDYKLQLIYKLFQIIESAKLNNIKPSYETRKDEISKFYYLTNKISIEGKLYDLWITICEDIHGNKFYNINENDPNKIFSRNDRLLQKPDPSRTNRNITDFRNNFNPDSPTVILSPFADDNFQNAFKIRIKPVVLGIGLNRGTPLEELELDVTNFLTENKLNLEDVKTIASFEAKKDEESLILFSEKNKIELNFFGKDEINSLNEDFSKSKAEEFFNIKGVAEPTAVLAAPFHTLFVKKKVYKNTTIAAAL